MRASILVPLNAVNYLDERVEMRYSIVLRLGTVTKIVVQRVYYIKSIETLTYPVICGIMKGRVGTLGSLVNCGSGDAPPRSLCDRMRFPLTRYERIKDPKPMIYYRACPRCHGDMHIKQDMYGEYKECLQCGYMLDIPKKLPKRYSWAELKPKARRKGKAA